MFVNEEGIAYLEEYDKCRECSMAECNTLKSIINMGKSKIYKGDICISSCSKYLQYSWWEDICNEVADADELEEIPY